MPPEYKPHPKQEEFFRRKAPVYQSHFAVGTGSGSKTDPTLVRALHNMTKFRPDVEPKTATEMIALMEQYIRWRQDDHVGATEVLWKLEAYRSVPWYRRVFHWLRSLVG